MSGVSLADASRASDRKDSTPQLRQETAALRDFGPAYGRFGSNSVVPVMSAARPLFPRQRTSIRDLAMSHSCQKATYAAQQNDAHVLGYSISSSASKLCVDLSDQGAAVEI